jgi:spermidine synthase
VIAGTPQLQVLFHDESPAATITGIRARREAGAPPQAASRGESPSAAATRVRTDARVLLINGIMTSGRGVIGELMAVLPDLLVDDPRSALVICFGGGNTFRAASVLGASVDVAELIGDVVRRMPFFYDDAAKYLDDPKNAIHIEDGRNYLLRSRKRYDFIVVDATPPLYSAGAVNLYTREFFGLARRRLTGKGVMALWLPTLSFESDYWHIISAFCGSFEHVALWRSPALSGFLVFGSPQPLDTTPALLKRRLRERVSGELPAWAKPGDPVFLRPERWMSEDDVRAYASGFAPLTDDRPTVEFPLARFWRDEPVMPTVGFLEKAVRPRGPVSGGPLGGAAREMP